MEQKAKRIGKLNIIDLIAIVLIVAVLALTAGDRLNFLATAGKDAVAAGAHAGKLVGAVAAVTGGKGGGRPDSAMAGGKDRSKLSEALASAEGTLSSMLK